MPVSEYYKPLAKPLQPAPEEPDVEDDEDVDAEDEDEPIDAQGRDLDGNQVIPPPQPYEPAKPMSDMDKIRDLMAQRDQRDQDRLNAFKEQQQNLQSKKDTNIFLAGMDRAGQAIGNFQGKVGETGFQQTAKDYNANIDEQAKQAKENLVTENALGAKPVENQFELLKGRSTELGNQAKEMDISSDAAKLDPASPYSVSLRNFVSKKLGQEFPATLPAVQIEKILPNIQAIYLQERQQEMQQNLRQDDRDFKQKELNQRLGFQKENLQDSRENRAAMLQARLEDQRQNKDTKRIEDLNKKLTEELASSRTTVGRASNGVYAADKIDALLAQTDAQGGKVTPQQLAEIATAMDSMIKGGASTVSGVEHLLPKTAAGKFSDNLSFIQSKPNPVELKEYLDLMRDTIHREKEVSSKTLSDFKQKTVIGYKDLAEKNPAVWQDLMKAHGLDNTGNAASAGQAKVSLKPGEALPP